MDEKAQREFLLGLCGYHRAEEEDYWFEPNTATAIPYEVTPDFLNDLNAMAMAESVLSTREDKATYYNWLRDCTVNPRSLHCRVMNFRAVTATAKVRAEALLRTLGLWEAATPEPLHVTVTPNSGGSLNQLRDDITSISAIDWVWTPRLTPPSSDANF